MFKKDGEKKEEPKKEASKEKMDVPASLPLTLLDKNAPLQMQGNTSEEEKGSAQQQGNSDKHRLPHDLGEEDFVVKKIVSQDDSWSSWQGEEKEEKKEEEEKKAKEEQSAQASSSGAEPLSIGSDEVRRHVLAPQAAHSYFNELEKRFSEEKSLTHAHFGSDMVSQMKEFHDSRMKGNFFFFNDKDIDEHIYKHLLELKELEAEWAVRFKELEAAKELLLDKEKEIESKIAMFKKTFREGEKFKLFNKRAPEGMAFRLENGVVLHTVGEFLFALREIPEEIFSHHVNESRNDFSLWVKHVFGADELAEKMDGARSVEEMVGVMESY